MRRRPVLTAAVLSTTLLVSGSALAGVSGVDVSRYQHPHGAAVSWKAAKAHGQSFAFIKATEGTTVRNAYFAADWRDARAAGIYTGAYHFARPNRTAGSAVAQADAFARVIGGQRSPGTLPPVLDLEADGGLGRAELIAWTRTWLKRVEALTKRKPLIYSYPGFWDASMGGTDAFASYGLWIAHYTKKASPRTGGWDRWTFWQYTSSGSVPGITGRVDMNRFNGTAQQLGRLALDPAAGPAPGTPGGVTAPDLLTELLGGLLPDS